MVELVLPLALLVAYGIFVWFLWRDSFGVSRSTMGRGVTTDRFGMDRERVLFVCTHNSARSQMAEAVLRDVAPTRFVVASAGMTPTRVHPLAAQVMSEQGVSLASHVAKSLTDVGGPWDYVITVCDSALEVCPDFPAKTSRLHWSVRDPAAAARDSDDGLEHFRRARDELRAHIARWLAGRPERLDGSPSTAAPRKLHPPVIES